MRVIKHAFLSLIRKPTKAIMIFAILFVVYALVFTGIIIQNSVKSSKEYVRKELGAVVEMRADYTRAINENLSNEEGAEKLALSISLAKEIAKDPKVKALYYDTYAGAVNNDLQSAINLDTGSSGDSVVVTSTTVTTSADGSSGESQEVNFTLLGSNADTPLEFADGTLKITQGRVRNETDKGKDTLLISEEFATKNNLSVGDMLDLISMADQQTYPFEIIGIYSGSSEFMVDDMLTSLESARKMSGKEGEMVNAASIKFLLEDSLEVKSFIKQYENRMPNDYISLYSNDSQYKTLTKPLDIVQTIISILLVIVFIAGVIIMLAIITMFVRDRRFEIGLLLSSGEEKLKILFQFILEILVISVIAFGIAAGASKFSADYAASWIVENQLVEDNTQNFNSGNVVTFSSNIGESNNTLKMSDIAKEFNVAVDKDVFINLMLLSFGLTIISAGAPLLIIFGYKPRESLQN